MTRERRHVLEYALFRGLSGVLRALPEGLALRLGAAVGWFVGTLLGLRRGVVRANLRLAFPERSEAWRRRVARASWAHLGRETVATFRLADATPEALLARCDFTGLEAFEAAVAEGRGVVLVSGHLGNWEVGGASLAARGLPVDAVAKGMANRRFEEDVTATRHRLGLRIVEMGQAPRAVPRSLAAGRIAALVADQDMHRNGVFVPFFGVPAATARGPAVFALRSGAPVFLGIPLRSRDDPRRFDMRLERIKFEPGGTVEEDVRRLTALHTRALEAAVRSAPEQYFWQHKRWKTQPKE